MGLEETILTGEGGGVVAVGGGGGGVVGGGVEEEWGARIETRLCFFSFSFSSFSPLSFLMSFMIPFPKLNILLPLSFSFSTFSPFSPFSTFSPLSPLSPFSPLSPLSPFSPFSFSPSLPPSSPPFALRSMTTLLCPKGETVRREKSKERKEGEESG